MEACGKHLIWCSVVCGCEAQAHKVCRILVSARVQQLLHAIQVAPISCYMKRRHSLLRGKWKVGWALVSELNGAKNKRRRWGAGLGLRIKLAASIPPARGGRGLVGR